MPKRFTLLVPIFAGVAGLFSAGTLRAHLETDVAISELSSLIERAPWQPSLWLSRSTHLRAHGRWKEAESDLREAARLDPSHPGLHLAFAQLYLESGRTVKALEALDRLGEESPGDATVLILRARLRTRTGNPGAAYEDYSRALRSLAEPRPELFLERALLPVAPELALAGLDEGIVRVGPAVALVEKAVELELKLGRVDEAALRLETLASQCERQEHWHYRRGAILAQAGRAEQAREAFRDALVAVRSLPDWLRRDPACLQLEGELTALVEPTSPPPASL